MSNRARVWVVCAIDWAYDDQFYEQRGYGDLSSSFTVKELAEDHARDLNVKYARHKYTTLYDFMYYNDLSVNTDILIEEGMDEETAHSIEEEIANSSENLSDFTDEEVALILKACDLSFYNVVEVEIYA